MCMAMATGIELLLAIFVATHFGTQDLVLARPNHLHYRSLPRTAAQLQASATPCQDAGFVGCCDLLDDGNLCYRPLSNCYCDLSCHLYGDCCDDIANIGCFPPGQNTCPDLPAIQNGRITYAPHSNPKRPGTIAHYKCDDSYGLVGNFNRVCKHDLTWEGSQPECRKTCAALPAPENGQVTYEPHTSSSQKPNRTVAIYSCSDGYILNPLAAKNRMCVKPGESHEWSGDNINCFVYSCQAAFPETNGCCDESANSDCHIGVHGHLSCSCSKECFTNPHIKCCPDIGCAPMTCNDANLSRGCCTWGQYGCYVPGGHCYCDEECSNFDDCCDDVPKNETCPSTQQEAKIQSGKTCASLGFDPGCCDSGPCHVEEENCYCDQVCHEYGDCCSDVETDRECPTYSVNQLISGQRAKTKPWFYVQMASRLKETQNQKLADDQSVRRIASQLRSLAQTQELLNKQQQAQWETILSELQEIQKNKK